MRDPEILDNPFTPEKVGSQISLSVFNRPKTMTNRARCLSLTADELVRKLPGWKPAPLAATADGEAPAEQVDMNATMREPILPKFSISDKFDLISKNETDSVR